MFPVLRARRKRAYADPWLVIEPMFASSVESVGRPRLTPDATDALGSPPPFSCPDAVESRAAADRSARAVGARAQVGRRASSAAERRRRHLVPAITAWPGVQRPVPRARRAGRRPTRPRGSRRRRARLPGRRGSPRLPSSPTAPERNKRSSRGEACRGAPRHAGRLRPLASRWPRFAPSLTPSGGTSSRTSCPTPTRPSTCPVRWTGSSTPCLP